MSDETTSIQTESGKTRQHASARFMVSPVCPSQHPARSLPRRPELLRGCWESHAHAISVGRRSVVVGHGLMHQWTIAVACDIRLQALHVRLAPSHPAHPSGRSRPHGKPFRRAHQALRSCWREKIDKCVASSAACLEIDRQLQKIEAPRETLGRQHFLPATSRAIFWQVLYHHSRPQTRHTRLPLQGSCRHTRLPLQENCNNLLKPLTNMVLPPGIGRPCKSELGGAPLKKGKNNRPELKREGRVLQINVPTLVLSEVNLFAAAHLDSQICRATDLPVAAVLMRLESVGRPQASSTHARLRLVTN